MNQQVVDYMKGAGDVTSFGAAWAALAGILPPVASLFVIIWTGFRLWEMVTGRPFSESTLARWLMSWFKP